MSKKKKSNLQVRIENQVQRQAAYEAALKKAKKAEQLKHRTGPKRGPAVELQKYLAVSIDHNNRLRSADAWESRTYNETKRVMELIQYLFVRYPVPLFLYRSILSAEGRQLVLGESRASAMHRDSNRLVEFEQDLFFRAAQGRSIADALQGDLTRKEAHIFFRAPDDLRVKMAIEWAKMTSAGVPATVVRLLLTRVVQTKITNKLGQRWQDVVRFFAREGARMTPQTAAQLVDFVIAMAEDKNFSFAQRTLASMIELCGDWHRHNSWGVLREYRSWLQSYPTTILKDRGVNVSVMELTNNRALHEESRTQKHCVFTYSTSCEMGTVRIVSFRWKVDGKSELDQQELQRITCEIGVRDETIYQIRGRANRRVDDDEFKLIARWAKQSGIKIWEHAR